jgi:hypothetical protein
MCYKVHQNPAILGVTIPLLPASYKSPTRNGGNNLMPKIVDPLTEDVIASATASERAHSLFDGGGLFLLVSPSGGKRWRCKYRYQGKEKMLSLGVYPEISLDDARSRRDAARELLAQGIDPSVSRKEEKARNRAKKLQVGRMPSVRVTIDGTIEIWKGGNTMRFKEDEARFVATLLNKIVG